MPKPSTNKKHEYTNVLEQLGLFVVFVESFVDSLLSKLLLTNTE